MVDYKKRSIVLGKLLTVFIFAFVIIPLFCGYELQFIGLGGWKLEEIYQLAGIIAPFAAIFLSIEIPKKIADRQDKIALFEYRLECYKTFKFLYVYTNSVRLQRLAKIPMTLDKYEKSFESTKNSVPSKKSATYESESSCLLLQMECLDSLFTLNDEVTETLKNATAYFYCVCRYLSDNNKNKKARKYQLDFEKDHNKLEELFPKVEEALLLMKEEMKLGNK